MTKNWLKTVLGVLAASVEATGITQAQFASWAKTSLGIIGSAAVTHGIGNASVWEALSGVVVALIPYAWGWAANTLLAQVKQTSSLPEVKQVVLKSSAGNGLAAAAADPAQPKIVKE